ncbi:hypothetical protein, partial [Cohnella zeiphila]|uniref:hypothetical protein n=1 Tax=Cohnella zeiphila TaxID=2761120 RepID=UPI001EE2EFDC
NISWFLLRNPARSGRRWMTLSLSPLFIEIPFAQGKAGRHFAFAPFHRNSVRSGRGRSTASLSSLFIETPLAQAEDGRHLRFRPLFIEIPLAQGTDGLQSLHYTGTIFRQSSAALLMSLISETYLRSNVSADFMEWQQRLFEV